MPETNDALIIDKREILKQLQGLDVALETHAKNDAVKTAQPKGNAKGFARIVEWIARLGMRSPYGVGVYCVLIFAAILLWGLFPGIITGIFFLCLLAAGFMWIVVILIYAIQLAREPLPLSTSDPTAQRDLDLLAATAGVSDVALKYAIVRLTRDADNYSWRGTTLAGALTSVFGAAATLSHFLGLKSHGHPAGMWPLEIFALLFIGTLSFARYAREPVEIRQAQAGLLQIALDHKKP